MKIIFKTGDVKIFSRLVTDEDTAGFDAGKVHDLYSTFALGRDAEWCTRLFVLEMKEEDEEGIGTYLQIEHLSPAKVGSTVIFTGVVASINGNELTCDFEAKVEERLIAKGVTRQKILKREKLDRLMESL